MTVETDTAKAAPSTSHLATHALDLNVTCDICGKARSAFRHDRCSRKRQKRMTGYWASIMANQAAKRAQGQWS